MNRIQCSPLVRFPLLLGGAVLLVTSACGTADEGQDPIDDLVPSAVSDATSPGDTVADEPSTPAVSSSDDTPPVLSNPLPGDGDTSQTPDPGPPPSGPTPQPTEGPTCGIGGLPCCDGDACNPGLDCLEGICSIPQRDFVCEEAPICLEPPISQVDAEVTTAPGSPPRLEGGDIVDSLWRLESIRLYPEGAFSSFVSIEMESNGQTYGSLTFEDDEWAVSAELDLLVTAGAAFLGEQSFPVDFAFSGGGCFIFEGNRIFTDVQECVDLSEVPDGLEIPESFTFTFSEDSVEMLFLITREAILEGIGGAGGGVGGFDPSAFITGDIPLVLSFVPFGEVASSEPGEPSGGAATSPPEVESESGTPESEVPTSGEHGGAEPMTE